jgi:hypothetical protein
VDAPALLLAVPAEAVQSAQQTADELVSLIRAEQPGIDVRAAYLAPASQTVRESATASSDAAPDESQEPTGSEGVGFFASVGLTSTSPYEAATLATLLGEAHAAGRPAPIVVPLLPGTDSVLERALDDLSATVGEVRVTEPLGPHPLLAEALHVRLSEAGLARADRARLFAVSTAADGIVLVSSGGADSLQRAEVTGVLLAARLAVPVVAAALDQPGSVAAAVGHLRETGCAQPALAPYLIGPEFEADQLKVIAHETDCPVSEPLGTYPTIAKLVLGHYLAALGIDQDLQQA